MKLKSREADVIGELIYDPDKEYHFTVATGNALTMRIYKKLADLYRDWEDMPEEPKQYYYITSCGVITPRGYQLWENESVYDKKRKEIGNYFETKEEAEKALEKLRAWKRLKDKGFESFSSEICGDDFVVSFKLTNHTGYSQSMDDFACILGFGGEE